MSATISYAEPAATSSLAASMQDDYPGVDKHSCQLLGPTALIVQGLMGIFVILSLAYKRHREVHKRPWRIWLFDVGKQVVGQMFVHGVNVLVSDLVSRGTDENACVAYFFNVLVDTTLGVALLYMILHVLTYLAVERLGLEGFQSGVYGKPPAFVYWTKQTALYVVALTTMKFLVVGLLAIFPGLFVIGAWLLSWTKSEKGDSLQVIFVMGIFPIIMNTLQFWLIDSIVKASPEESVSLNTDAHDGLDREPLFRASEDDDGGADQVGQQRYDVENPRALSSSSPEHGSASSGNTSGSVTPVPTGSKESESDTGAHSYPPSLSSSITSTSSSMSSLGKPPIREATKLGKKRKTAPTPLHVHQSSVPAINSPGQITAPLEPKTQDISLQAAPQQSHDWDDGWGDEADDWADKVGEEDWTGRRLGEARLDLDNTWSRGDGQISRP
ncbi:hypothetical protein CYLTODRAFT_416551 [Cylindrobasidium torrendii FP15055 ss-10]|uniref:Uncharacterized protein n=1 Tax=Cylindrobasidium torrendii FP15055 ss-10 TaxID=1314674 RepID=A0A0D7BUH5_9AGAR|nr:hypothetical protein CYLTODRAFT_416551 [Cylindrobasidium torrendii FP15055 ss-10]